jgi:hypothetical protein
MTSNNLIIGGGGRLGGRNERSLHTYIHISDMSILMVISPASVSLSSSHSDGSSQLLLVPPDSPDYP